MPQLIQPRKMASMSFPPKIILAVIIIFSIDQIFGSSEHECATDCICYYDHMSNLASWKWIEKDINIQKDDPLHEDFNPYTEHNEVYDNPISSINKLQEAKVESATCILRTNLSSKLQYNLNGLSPSLEVLTLIQVPGSGAINLEKAHFEKFNSLVGLEIQGYSSTQHNYRDTLRVAADAFDNLMKLMYVSIDNVILNEKSVENQNHDTIQTITYNYTADDNSYQNEVNRSEVILLKVHGAGSQDNKIVPYSVYKESQGKSVQPVLPKIAVAFTGLPALQHLRISGCNMQDISWDMFYKLDNLKYLLLDSNDLLFLPDFVFYATSNLTALSLSNNKILNLQTVGLVGLLHLQKLDVSYNNITILSELSLPPFPHLEVADFRHNPIESIFPNTFEIMNSTKTLFLGSHTTPLEISQNSFYGLISLTRLDIINVKAEMLERTMLKGMPQLRSLTMTGKITRILYDAFSEVPKLEKLIMKQSSIKKISMDAFFGLTALIELDLSHNNLTFLPPGIFDQQVSLREVFLQQNNLQTLPANIFSKLPAKIIRLEDNPWHCSCDLKYWDSKLVNRVKRYHVPISTSMCEIQYDKGSQCKNLKLKFDTKYVYEKRVSPTCETPMKFNRRNVFDVLRKGLHYCANSLQQNISILLTSSNPTDKLEIMGTVKVPIHQNKEKETQLLFPPKIKKPWKANKISQLQENNSLTTARPQILRSSTLLKSFGLDINFTTAATIKESPRKMIPAKANSQVQEEQMSNSIDLNPNSRSIITFSENNRLNTIPRSTAAEEDNGSFVEEPANSNNYPQISKKARKYAMLQQQLKRQQQQFG